MRVCVLVLALAAGATADRRKELEPLVEQLGSPYEELRTRARLKLAAYGEKIVPLLKTWQHDDPEVRRALRRVVASYQRLNVELAIAPESRSLGMPLILTVDLINDTQYSICLQATNGAYEPDKEFIPASLEVPTTSSLEVVLEGDARKKIVVRPDEVEVLLSEKQDAGDGLPGLFPFVPPGGRLRIRIVLRGLRSPLSRPGRHEVTVAYSGDVYRVIHAPEAFDLRVLKSGRYASNAVRLEAKGRSARELQAAIESGSKKAKESALAELTVRDDPAVLPVLRKHRYAPGIFQLAVTRLGTAGQAEDFLFIADVIKNSKDQRIRNLAIVLLPNFGQNKAHSALLKLAWDRKARLAAVEALRGYKHFKTIDRFVMILSLSEPPGPWVKPIQDSLWDWTGKHVEVTHGRREVKAFRKWWMQSRRQWIKDQKR